jgi:hypothetical protein
MINKVNLDYDFSTILAADYNQHEGSCMGHQKKELDDIYQKYGGYPDSFNYDNTKIHQLWWDRTQVDYEEFGRQLNMEVIMVSSILQEPGCMIPLHRDTFFQINKNYPDRKEIKVRSNIYLEDWKLGHFIQYSDEVSTHWQAGEGLQWDSLVEHLSANAGLQNKFTLQISGFLIE